MNPTNDIGVRWLLRRVWPEVQHAFAGAQKRVQLWLIGEQPRRGWGSATQEELRQQGVRVHGFVEDIVPLTEKCRVMVNPVQESSGFNTKNLVALENAIPLVTTSPGASGLIDKASQARTKLSSALRHKSKLCLNLRYRSLLGVS